MSYYSESDAASRPASVNWAHTPNLSWRFGGVQNGMYVAYIKVDIIYLSL